MAEEAQRHGNAAFRSYNYRQAIYFYTVAINLSPANHLLYSYRSVIYTYLHEYSDALADAQKTIQLNPTFANGYACLGLALFLLGSYREALSAFKNGLKLDPDNFTFYKRSIAKVMSWLPNDPMSGMLSKFFPNYTVENILLRLPVKSLLRFRSVSKSWISLITDTQFVRTHLERCIPTQCLMVKEVVSETVTTGRKLENYFIHNAYRNFDICGGGNLQEIDRDLSDFLVNDDRYALIVKRKAELIGSCDGLLCIKSRGFGFGGSLFFCVLNPSTREFKQLPVVPVVSVEPNCYAPSYGFGYDPSIDVYKLVSIVQFLGVDGSVQLQAYVFMLGLSNAWRRIQSVPCTMLSSRLGVLVSGHLHWVSHLESSPRVIVVFDVDDESFKQVSMPSCQTQTHSVKLVALGGSLHIVYELYNCQIELWVMKEYGVAESWTKVLAISDRAMLNPLWLSESGELGLQWTSELSADTLKRSTDLLMYDPRDETTQYLKVHETPKEFDANLYFRSLVSLHSDEHANHEGEETGDDKWKAEDAMEWNA